MSDCEDQEGNNESCEYNKQEMIEETGSEDLELEEIKDSSEQKTIFGQSHKYRLVKHYLLAGEIKENIKNIQEEFGISSGKAFQLLQKYDYNLPSVLELNLVDEIYIQQSQAIKQQECILCSDNSELFSLDCNHEFCKNCWSQYLQAGIENGREFTLLKKCPMDQCQHFVGFELFPQYLNYKFYIQYDVFLRTDFLLRNKKAKLCPGATCNNIIILNTLKGSINSIDDTQFNMVCDCTYSSCSHCRSEAHRPLSCQDFNQWMNLIGCKNDSFWFELNTRKCPNCTVNIEKNEGCMHMTCKYCNYEFCWKCFKKWSRYHGCNESLQPFQEKQQNQQLRERYDYFHSKFIEHRKQIDKLWKEKKKIENWISFAMRCDQSINLDFLIDTNQVVIEYRSLVAYCYPLAYYSNPSQKKFIELFQLDLERKLKDIEFITENKLYRFISRKSNILYIDEILKFENQLLGQTQHLKQYIESKMNELEKGITQDHENNNIISNQNSFFEEQKEEETPIYVCEVCDSINTSDVCETCILKIVEFN